MVSPRWRLMFRLLWGQKARSLMVVLSIAVGIFGIGIVAQMYVAATRDMATSYADGHPANAEVVTDESFDQELINVVRKMPGVQAAAGRRNLVVRFRTGSDPTWRPLVLFAVTDLTVMPIDTVTPVFDGTDFAAAQGHWPPGKREVAIERTSLLAAVLGLLHARVGDTLTIETSNHRQHTLRASGLAYDATRIPATFAGVPYGYITMSTLETLGEPRAFNELYITVTGDASDTQRTQQIVDQVRAKIEKSGRTVVRSDVPAPGKLPLDGMFHALTLILTLMSVLSLVLSGFLVVNTITALLKQQVRQLGVMKAIGARTAHLVRMYLVLTACFGVLASALAAPLAALCARSFTGFMSLFLNFRYTSGVVPPQVLVLEACVGMLVPLLAALYPVIAGARVTVLEALSDHGGTAQRPGNTWVDRLLETLRGLPRPMLLSLRNTFRRKQRVVLTLTTLTLASVTFVSVLSVRASLNRTLDQALGYWNYDVGLTLNRPYRVAQVEQEARSVPGVAQVESWDTLATFRVRPNNSEGPIMQLDGLPADSQMIKPILIAGRWLQPSDTNALVVNAAVRDAEPDLALGGTIMLKINDRKTIWQVVGVVQGLGPELTAYATSGGFATMAQRVGRASSIQIVTTAHDGDFQHSVAKAVEARLKAHSIELSTTQVLSDIRDQNESLFTILTMMLLLMAFLLTAVGGLGLMGTMSINVIERTREIGVMRAIGASDESIGWIFTVEAIIIALLSAVLGSVLALPIGKYVSNAVGQQIFQTPLSYTFSLFGVAVWLVGMVLLAVIASLLPARHAMRLRVREVLAHE